MNNRKKKTIVFIIASVLIAISVIIAILLSSYGPYDRVTQRDERTVLFVITIGQDPVSGYDSNNVIFVDNSGNIYIVPLQNKLAESIANGEIWEGDIVGEVPADEAMSYYYKLCKINEELFFYYREGGGIGMEVYYFYYGIRYVNGKVEIVDIGSSDYYTENKYAESIVEWMKEWEYEDN